MTSWKRGRKNEQAGDEKLSEPGVVEKVQGAVQKAAGLVEQGVDNVVDRVTGKQGDLKGAARTGGRGSSKPKTTATATATATKAKSTKAKSK